MRLAVDLRSRCALPAAFRMQQGAALRRCWYAGRTADVVAAFGHGVASAVWVGWFSGWLATGLASPLARSTVAGWGCTCGLERILRPLNRFGGDVASERR